MELKTNEDGKTIIDVLPIGDTVRLQIIASGFQTSGRTTRWTRPTWHRNQDEAAGGAVLHLQGPRKDADAARPRPQDRSCQW